MSFVCAFYGFGQITKLNVTHYWCDRKTLDEIREHSIEYNLNHGTSDGCWKSTQFNVDKNSLFDISIYDTNPDITSSNVLKCIIWQFYSIWFFSIATGFFSLFCADFVTICCKFSRHRQEKGNCTHQTDRKDPDRKRQGQSKKSSFRSCCPCQCKNFVSPFFLFYVCDFDKFLMCFLCFFFLVLAGCTCLPKDNEILERIGDFYWLYIKLYKHYFGEDTRNWFILLMIREIIEIVVQIFALCNMNGLNLFYQNQIVLSSKEFTIKLFTILLCLNSITVGILWILYLVQNKLCHGELFKQSVFVIDTIFDTFYALFPIIIVANENGLDDLNFNVAIGSLQSKNTYV